MDNGEGFKKYKTINPYPIPNLFSYTNPNPIFVNKELKPNNLDYWNEWDMKKAEIQNQSIGPRNAFEEQIEWTKKGKMWPYPIDNEYLFGLEHQVSFNFFNLNNADIIY